MTRQLSAIAADAEGGYGLDHTLAEMQRGIEQTDKAINELEAWLARENERCEAEAAARRELIDGLSEALS